MGHLCHGHRVEIHVGLAVHLVGRVVGVVHVQVDRGVRRDPERGAGRKAVVAPRLHGPAQEHVVAHRERVGEVQRTIRLANVAHGIGRGEDCGRRPGVERVKNEVVAEWPHGRLDARDIDVAGVAHLAVVEQLALEVRGDVEPVHLELEACPRCGSYQRLERLGGLEDLVRQQRCARDDAGLRGPSHNPLPHELELPDAEPGRAGGHRVAVVARVMSRGKDQLVIQQARIRLADHHTPEAVTSRVRVGGPHTDEVFVRHVGREDQSSQRARSDVTAHRGARGGQDRRLDLGEAGRAIHRSRRIRKARGAAAAIPAARHGAEGRDACENAADERTTVHSVGGLNCRRGRATRTLHRKEDCDKRWNVTRHGGARHRWQGSVRSRSTMDAGSGGRVGPPALKTERGHSASLGVPSPVALGCGGRYATRRRRAKPMTPSNPVAESTMDVGSGVGVTAGDVLNVVTNPPLSAPLP